MLSRKFSWYLKASVGLLNIWIFTLKNTGFERMKPEKSESSAETCRNWIANWLKFQRIKISDLQDSISPRGGPTPETRGRLFYFSYDELSARACLCFFCFIFNSSERSRAESCVFCTVLAAGIQALSVFFSRVTLISAVWSMFVRWKVARIFLFTMRHSDRGLWIFATKFPEIKARWFLN